MRHNNYDNINNVGTGTCPCWLCGHRDVHLDERGVNVNVIDRDRIEWAD